MIRRMARFRLRHPRLWIPLLLLRAKGWRPQFTIADILWATALAGVGVAVGNDMPPNPTFPHPPGLSWVLHWHIAGIAIGAALLAPFRRKPLGAALGLAFQFSTYLGVLAFKT